MCNCSTIKILNDCIPYYLQYYVMLQAIGTASYPNAEIIIIIRYRPWYICVDLLVSSLVPCTVHSHMYKPTLARARSVHFPLAHNFYCSFYCYCNEPAIFMQNYLNVSNEIWFGFLVRGKAAAAVVAVVRINRPKHGKLAFPGQQSVTYHGPLIGIFTSGTSNNTTHTQQQ